MYRAAARLCGTSDKTVKRVVGRQQTGELGHPGAAGGGENKHRGREEPGGQEGQGHRGHDHGQAAVAAGQGGGLSRLSPQPAVGGGQGEGGLAPGAAQLPSLAAGGGGVSGRRLDPVRRLHLFCVVLPWSRWRFVRFARDGRAGDHAAHVRRVLRSAGQGADEGAHRPHELPQGGGGGKHGGAAPGVRAVRRSLPLQPRLLRGRRPGIEGGGRELVRIRAA